MLGMIPNPKICRGARERRASRKRSESRAVNGDGRIRLRREFGTAGRIALGNYARDRWRRRGKDSATPTDARIARRENAAGAQADQRGSLLWECRRDRIVDHRRIIAEQAAERGVQRSAIGNELRGAGEPGARNDMPQREQVSD